MKKRTDFSQPPPDPYPDKAAEPKRLRLLALTDAKLTHGAARLFCLLVEWSFELAAGGDGHGKVETTTRDLAAAMGCNKDYVTKWQRSLKGRKYVLVELVPCGRGLKRFSFRIVGLHQELSPEVGPVDGKTTVPTSGDNRVPTSGDDKVPTSGDDKSPLLGTSYPFNRLSGTGTPPKTAKSAELLKDSARSAVQQCKAPAGKKRIDTPGENEFLATIGRCCGELELTNWGGRWRNRYRGKDGELWVRVWRDVDTMRREGNPPEKPVHYAQKLFNQWARK